MDFKIDVKPEDIEAAVKDAIINSALGKYMKDAVHKALNDYRFTNAIEEVIRNIMVQEARKMIETDPEFQEKLLKVVRDKFAQENLISYIANKAFRDY